MRHVGVLRVGCKCVSDRCGAVTFLEQIAVCLFVCCCFFFKSNPFSMLTMIQTHSG